MEKVNLSMDAARMIEDIINRGAAAVVRKKQDDIIVLEEIRKTRYNPTCNGAGGRA